MYSKTFSFFARTFILFLSFAGSILWASISMAACSVKASFSTPTSAVNLNVPVRFLNTSTDALTYQWLIDDMPVGTSQDLTYTFTVQNIHKVKLIASNGNCHDTSSVFFIQTGCEKKRNTDKWYFGEGSAVDFSSGIPTAVSGCAMAQREGVASIADASGNLLFYTEGSQVWDANNTVMPNGSGLMGSWLSAQSSIIVPAPGNSNLYYVFTVHNWTDGSSEFCYSIVDMTLRAGLGDIIPGQKNILLQNNIYERVTTARHKNCRDIWIVSHEKNNNRYVAYLLTPSGITSPPVISDIGAVSVGINRFGGLRSSHNGHKICSTLGGSSQVVTIELFDFDDASGKLSNLVLLAANGESSGAYSSEFSANDRVLYACSYSGEYILQYDVYAGSPAAIKKSMLNIATGTTVKAALQIGPDGKIYVSEDYETALGVIDEPNTLGMGCNYRSAAVPIDGWARLGLPNFMPSLFGDAISIEGPGQLCGGSEATYAAAASFCLSNIHWEISGAGTISNNYTDSIKVKFPVEGGVCRLVVSGQGPCGEVSTELLINVLPPPSTELPADTGFCNAGVLLLNGPSGMSAYQWSSGNTTSSETITQPGKFWLTVTNAAGCKATDTIKVSSQNLPFTFSLGNDTAFCAGGSMVLTPLLSSVNYQWQDGTTNATYTVSGPGTYWVKAENSCLISHTDTIVVSQSAAPVVSLGADTMLCQNKKMVLHATPGFVSYHWQDGSALADLNVIHAGNYSVAVTDSNGCKASDTISVGIYSPIFTSVFPDKNITHCFDIGPVALEAKTGSSFYWDQNGNTTPVLLAQQPGTYSIIAKDGNGCEWKDQITVTQRCTPEIYLPSAFTPNQDGNNDVLEIFGKYFTNFKITIFNRWGEIIFISTDRYIQWDGYYRGEEMPIGTYPWIVHYESIYSEDAVPKDLKGSVTVIR